MILKALADYQAPDAPPIGYATKPVGFSLKIPAAANSCRIATLHEPVLAANGKPTNRFRGRAKTVPDLTRSNNPPPILGVDTAEFVLGGCKKDLGADAPVDEFLALFDFTDSQESVVAQRKHEQFKNLLREYAQATGSEDAAIAIQWYDAGRPGLKETLAYLTPEQRKSLTTERVEMVVNNRRLADSKTAREFWARKAFASKGSGRSDVCLVCGESAELLDTLPLSLTGSLVPGASASNVALTSSNFASAQRGASGSGLSSIPVCGTCGARAAQNFNILAADPNHRWGRGGDADGLIWWQSNNAADPAVTVVTDERVEPEAVRTLLCSIQKVDAQLSDSVTYQTKDRFYALTFSGNVARFVVRSWLDLPLQAVASNINDWFGDTESMGRCPFHSVRSLAICAGPIGRGSQPDKAPHGLQSSLLEVALTGRPLGQQLLSTVLSRARAEQHLTDHSDERFASRVRGRAHARAGLIRLILNRTAYKEAPMASYLDDDREDTPYLYGRLFAERENLQRRALGDVNASISDRFFTRASTNPASVEGALARLEEKHARALGRKESSSGATFGVQKRLGQLRARAGDPPTRMTDVEQGAWLTGYYQQRQHNIEQAIARSNQKQQETDAESQENS